ncbi:MAG: UbiA family prenyltransferase [bacterium]
MNIIKKAVGLLRLYRCDVPVIVFLATFAGRFFTTGFTVNIVYEALFIAFLPYNFVYVLNSITDVLEDSVNKPSRPIPSGDITRNEAIVYLMFLAVFSVVGISFLFKGIEMFLAFLIIFLGFSYSLPPFVFKKRAFAASVVTGWGVMHPLFITGGLELFSFSLSVMFHAIGTTTLKDLSDEKGDKLAGRDVFIKKAGLKAVLTVSIGLSMVSLISFQFTKYPVASIVPAASIAVIALSYFFKRDSFENSVYHKTIWTTALLSVATIVCIHFFY